MGIQSCNALKFGVLSDVLPCSLLNQSQCLQDASGLKFMFKKGRQHILDKFGTFRQTYTASQIRPNF